MAKSAVKSNKDTIGGLYRLQLIDSKIDEIQIMKGELPIEVSDLEDEIAGMVKRSERLKGSVDEIKNEVARHEANIKESNTLVERYEKQLDEVKNNREFNALSKEIELQKLEVKLSEKKIKETAVKLDAKSATLNETVEKLDKRKNDLDQKKIELEKILEKTNKEEKKLNNESKKAQAEIEERLLISYKRIRERYKNGRAVVKIERDACGGCFNRIPPQVKIEIGLYKNTLACEHCGRVLIDDNLAAKVEKK
ncbi:MAG: C4-type zinc ribbon domain-containing protein [Saprospiraceae bacterium]